MFDSTKDLFYIVFPIIICGSQYFCWGTLSSRQGFEDINEN
jgi:hypothetical protein